MACQSCKSKNSVKNVQKWVIIFGLYFFGAAVYGTVEIIKNIIEFFK